MKTKAVEYEVEGQGTFPFDMLRYDGSYPARGEDATLLDTRYFRPDEVRAVRRIRLRCSNAGSTTPEVDRWASFGWSVVRDSIRRY